MQALAARDCKDSLFGFQGVVSAQARLESKEVQQKKRSGKAKAGTKLSLRTFFLERKYAPLAQLVEQLTLNQWVPGSNP